MVLGNFVIFYSETAEVPPWFNIKIHKRKNMNCFFTSLLSDLLPSLLSKIILTLRPRRKEKIEKFENALDAYSLILKCKPAEKYDAFSMRFILMEEPERLRWLNDYHITEIKDFYNWLSKKAPHWSSFYNKFGKR